jgi:hypothetical protein
LSPSRIGIGVSVDKLVVLRVELLGGLQFDILIVVALEGGHGHGDGDGRTKKRKRCWYCGSIRGAG